MTDLLGTSLIIGYMVYNLYFPIIPEKKKIKFLVIYYLFSGYIFVNNKYLII